MAYERVGGGVAPRKRRRGRSSTVSIPKAPPRRPTPVPGAYPRDPVRAPAPVPTAPTYAAGGMTGGMGAGYDVNSDPAVAAAQGLAAKMRARAQAVAAAKRAQAAIEYGDPEGVTGLDDKTKTAARDNPFSVLKNLAHSNETGTRDLEEGLNKANLFYSGYRGKQLAENARGYQNARYQAGTNFRALQSGIDSDLADALLNADIYEQSALMNSSGGSYGYGDEGGGGSYGGGGGKALANLLGAAPRPGPVHYGVRKRKPLQYAGNQNTWRGN